MKGKKVIHWGGGENTKSYATGKPMLQTLPNLMNMFTKLYTIIKCKKKTIDFFLPLKKVDRHLKKSIGFGCMVFWELRNSHSHRT